MYNITLCNYYLDTTKEDTDASVLTNRAEVRFLRAIIDGTSNGEQLLDFAGDDANYGRADKVAAKMLLARLYLNAEVYTGTARWSDAAAYAGEVINSQYKLNTTASNGYSAYEQLFMGDNGENPNARQEIIFPIRCDGATSRSYGGSNYTIASTNGQGTPDQSLPSSQWTCNRARQALIDKFTSVELAMEQQGYSRRLLHHRRRRPCHVLRR